MMDKGEIRLARAFSLSSSMVLVMDADDGAIVDVNAAFEKITGFSRAEVLGKRTIDIGLWPDLELRSQRYDAARSLLAQATGGAPSRRGRWLSAPIACELARRTGADRATLEQHEATLRNVLQEMIAEWREVDWERESTGFLRLGSRLRIVGELVGVTMALHGPERALEDVRGRRKRIAHRIRQRILEGTHRSDRSGGFRTTRREHHSQSRHIST